MELHEIATLPRKPVTAISYSQVNTFLDCRMAYYLRYILGVKKPPTLPMMIGSAFHATMRHFFNYRMLYNFDFTLDQLTKILEAEFAHLRTEAGLPFIDPEAVAKMLNGTQNVLEYYHTAYMGGIDPAASELTMTTTLDNGKSFTGIVDLIQKDGIMIDWKITGSTWNQSKAESSTQSQAYALLAGGPVDFEYHVGYRARKTNPVAVFKVSRTQQDIDDYLELLNRVCLAMDEMADGHLAPTCKTGYCSPAMCSYSRECQYLKYHVPEDPNELEYEIPPAALV